MKDIKEIIEKIKGLGKLFLSEIEYKEHNDLNDEDYISILIQRYDVVLLHDLYELEKITGSDDMTINANSDGCLQINIYLGRNEGNEGS